MFWAIRRLQPLMELTRAEHTQTRLHGKERS